MKRKIRHFLSRLPKMCPLAYLMEHLLFHQFQNLPEELEHPD